MPGEDLLARLRRFHDGAFPLHAGRFRELVEAGRLTQHGWHFVIEDGQVHVFDVASGRFVAASEAGHAGTGPYRLHEEPATGSLDADQA